MTPERRSISQGRIVKGKEGPSVAKEQPRGTPDDVRISLGLSIPEWLNLSQRNQSILVEMHTSGVAQNVRNRLRIDEEERTRNQPYAPHIPQFVELLCQNPDLLVDHFLMRRAQTNLELGKSQKKSVAEGYKTNYPIEVRDPWRPVLMAITKYVELI